MTKSNNQEESLYDLLIKNEERLFDIDLEGKNPLKQLSNFFRIPKNYLEFNITFIKYHDSDIEMFHSQNGQIESYKFSKRQE